MTLCLNIEVLMGSHQRFCMCLFSPWAQIRCLLLSCLVLLSVRVCVCVRVFLCVSSWTRVFLRRSAWCPGMRRASWWSPIRTWSAALTAPSRSCRPQPLALCSAPYRAQTWSAPLHYSGGPGSQTSAQWRQRGGASWTSVTYTDSCPPGTIFVKHIYIFFVAENWKTNKKKRKIRLTWKLWWMTFLKKTTKNLGNKNQKHFFPAFIVYFYSWGCFFFFLFLLVEEDALRFYFLLFLWNRAWPPGCTES